jgi:plastocyanin
MNKTLVAGIAAGILVLGLILAPLSNDQFASAKHIKRIVQTKEFQSMQDPGQGHELHKIAIILPPAENVVYTGRFTYSASAPVEVVVLHDIKAGETPAKIYTIDGQKKWALSLIKLGGDVGTAAGSMSFAGAALALHTLDGSDFKATVTVHAQARAMMGELPTMTPPATDGGTPSPPPVTGDMAKAKTITVSEWAPWFQPSALQVDPGTPIVWDADETSSIHTITFVTRVTDLQLNMDPEFTAKTFTLLSPGDKSPVWTPEAGVYVYVCAIHPYMTGVVSAGVPYNAITGEMGTGEGDPTVAKFAPWYPSVAPWQDQRPFRDIPSTPGIGEVWVDTQFEVAMDPNSPTGRFGKSWPGTITIVDAENWEVMGKITEGLNNPHNLMSNELVPSGDAGGDYMIQSNWHDDYLTLINARTKEVVKNYIQTGFDPAHVSWTEDNMVIAGVNAGAELQIFDGAQITDRDIAASDIKPMATIKASLPLAGPHGFWYKDRLISVPYHLANHMVIIGLDESKELFPPINISELPDDITSDPDDMIGAGIDLASYLGPEINGHRFWVTTEVLLEHAKLLQGRLLIYDIGSAVGGPENPTFVKMLEVGSIPIQSPVTPDGRYVVTANAGGIGVKASITVTELDYNNPTNSRIVAELPSYPGSHGVEYGFKKGGGLYAYVSNKFAPVLQVVDLTTNPPRLVGEVDLGNGWGGMGIMTMPSAAYFASLDEHPHGKLYK